MSPIDRNGASRASHPMPMLSVLVAVEPLFLQRLIGHLLRGQAGIRVVGRAGPSLSLAQRAARHTPDVIIVDHLLRRRVRRDVLLLLKRASPSSTVILLTDCLTDSAPPEVADAWLPEDAVVRQLLPAIREAAPRTPSPAVRPASAGRHT